MCGKECGYSKSDRLLIKRRNEWCNFIVKSQPASNHGESYRRIFSISHSAIAISDEAPARYGICFSLLSRVSHSAFADITDGDRASGLSSADVEYARRPR